MIPLYLYDIIPFITVSFTTILLFIIYFKTPKYMKNFKFYVIQNVTFTLCSEFVLLICPCIFLHPIITLEPIGLTTNIHYNIVLILCCFGGCCYLACMDCSIAMIFERYFALKSGISRQQSKIPIYIYGFLISSDVMGFFICAICIFVKPISNLFRNPTQPGFEFPKNYFVVAMPLLAFLTFLRIVLIITGFVMNMKVSKSLNSGHQLSTQVQKSNEALRRLIYIQFSGYFFLLCCPILFIIYAYNFIDEPSNIPTYSVFVIMTFGFYDTLFTAFFIKPYKKALIFPFTWIRKASVVETQNSRNSILTL